MKHDEIKVGMRVRIKNNTNICEREKAKRHVYGVVTGVVHFGCFPISLDIANASLRPEFKGKDISRNWAAAPYELVRA